MAEFTPNKINPKEINGGERFTNGDGVDASAINAPIEAAAYVQGLATNQPDTTNAGLVGTPSVSIEEVDGLPRFKFEYLKGEKGIDGKDHSAEIQEINNSISVLEGVQKDHSAEIQANSSSIETLEKVLIQKGQMDIIEVEQAYTSRETANGANIVDGQHTEVTEIKGSTVKCENLIPYPYDGLPENGSITNNGITWTDNGDGSVTVNGTATANSIVYMWRNHRGVPNGFSVGKYYAFVGINWPVYMQANKKTASSDDAGWLNGNGTPALFDDTIEALNIYMGVLEGNTVNNVTVYPMLNEGETAKPFQPYFTDLKHAYINSIKSTGRNLIPYPYKDTTKTESGITFTDNGDGSITANGTATGRAQFIVIANSSNKKLIAGTYTISGCPIGGSNGGYGVWSIVGKELGSGLTFTYDTESQFYINITIEEGTTVNNLVFKPMLNRGETALPYEPYTADTYQLPQTLELGQWDSFNPATGELVKGTSKLIVLDGTENWILERINGVGLSNFFIDTKTAIVYNTGICNYYDNTQTSIVDATEEGVVFSAAGGLYFRTFDYTTLGEWTDHLEALAAAGTPLMVAYKLATPTVEKLENAPKSYKVHNHGSETVNQGATDNSKYGAMPTVTNEYVVILGEDE